MHERVVPIIEGILTDSDYEEVAVNLPNDGYIDGLPSFLSLEVPAIVTKHGLKGILFENYPKGFKALLSGQVGTNDLIADAIINGSRELAFQALLADPCVHKYEAAAWVFVYMFVLQEKYLSYLK